MSSNMLVMEACHATVKRDDGVPIENLSLSSFDHRIVPFNMIMRLHYLIITDTNRKVFRYMKSYYNRIYKDRLFPLAELPALNMASNMLVMEACHVTSKRENGVPIENLSLSSFDQRTIPFNMVMRLHYFIITDTNRKVFRYMKSYSVEIDKNRLFPLEELPAHLERISESR